MAMTPQIVINRAVSLGITGPLTPDQMISLDANMQADRLATALAPLADLVTALGGLAALASLKDLATATAALAAAMDGPVDPLTLALQKKQLEMADLHVFYDRHLYAQQGVDVSSVPTAEGMTG